MTPTLRELAPACREMADNYLVFEKAALAGQLRVVATAAAQAEKEAEELREVLRATTDQLRTTLGDIGSENSFGWAAVEQAEKLLRITS